MNPADLPGQVEWPEPPGEPPAAQAELAKVRYQAEVDELKARLQAQIDEIKAQWRDQAARDVARDATEDKLRADVQSAYLDVAKGAYDRMLERAKFVTTASGAIATVYTGLVGLVYSASATTGTGNKPNPLPATGIWPAVFLGLALVLSAYYVSFVHRKTKRGHYLPTGTGPNIQEMRMLFFLEWISEGTLQRAWALRLSVLGLGVGVALTPLPFLQITDNDRWLIIAVGIIILVLALLVELGLYLRQYRAGGKPTGSIRIGLLK